METWWEAPLRAVFEGRRVVVAGAVAAAWTGHVDVLRAAGATDVLIVATEGRGIGPVPEAPTVLLEPPPSLSLMERLHHGNATLADPPPTARAALDEFDPTGEALVVGSFLNPAPALAGRPFVAHRRPSWVALEDKVVIDRFWDRAGVRRLPSVVVSIDGAADAAAGVDRGAGTVWAADARDGLHGGATRTRWVTDDPGAVAADLRPVCDSVRVMPFVEGVPCAVHGIVLPDGVVVVRPVEMVTLRRGHDLVYAGCATYWDPPGEIRDEMRGVARRAGEQLAREVDFRGAFTVDGVAAADGFWPTEMNPRFGAGLTTIARAAGEVPLLLVNDLIVAGRPIGRTAADLEAELVEAADEHRGGGTWMLDVADDATAIERPVVVDDGAWRWAADGEEPAGQVVGGAGFVRNTYTAATAAGVPVGPPTAPLAAAFWDFADRRLGTGTGGLSAASDPYD